MQVLNGSMMNGLLNGAPLVGRLLMAAIFLLSGFGKAMGPAATKAYIVSKGMPLPEIAYWVALIVELLGGILLVVGYQTRLAAAALAVYTIATAIGFHTNFADQNQMIHFMKNLAMTGGLLQVVAFGAGAFSVDARRSQGLGHRAYQA